MKKSIVFSATLTFALLAFLASSFVFASESGRKRYAYINASAGISEVSTSPSYIATILSQNGVSAPFGELARGVAVKTLRPYKVTQDAITMSGVFNATLCSDSSTGYFMYAVNSEDLINSTTPELISGTGIMTATIENLTSGDTVTYQSFAVGCNEATYGEVVTEKTLRVFYAATAQKATLVVSEEDKQEKKPVAQIIDRSSDKVKETTSLGANAKEATEKKGFFRRLFK